MIGFILNLPYTIVGLMMSLISMPTKLELRDKPYAFVFHVKSFWWTVGYMKHARAVAIGHVVLLGPSLEHNDLEHELVHIEQHQRMPLV